jgi:hypothetical protein
MKLSMVYGTLMQVVMVHYQHQVLVLAIIGVLKYHDMHLIKMLPINTPVLAIVLVLLMRHRVVLILVSI